jgi:hypothetical protein
MRQTMTRHDLRARPAAPRMASFAAVARGPDLSMPLRAALLLCLLAALAGCGQQGQGIGRQQQTTFDGQVFRGNATADRDDRQRFVATVRTPSKSLEGAIEAAAHQGTRYCIETFGTSDIDWEIGPDTPPEEFSAEAPTLSLTGRCRDI